jgi:hypothetical protein
MSILAALFINPWFAVAGTLLASIPIVIHLLNRRRFKTVQWAAMEYLLQAMRKNRRRLKFEQWLLLAVRCLLIFLMGLALARPLGCDNPTIAALGGQRTALHVFVIDNSYSMAYEVNRPDAKTHLDYAKLMARRLLDRLSAGNEAVMVITAASPLDHDRSTDPRAATPKPTYDLQSARSTIDRIEQTAAGTDLDGALQLAIRTAQEETKIPTKRLYLFTDNTKSAFEGAGGKSVDALKQAGPELVKHFGKPSLFALGKPGQWNQAVLDVAPAVNLVTTKFSADFVTHVKGYGAGPDPMLQWKMNDAPVGQTKPVKLDLDTQPQSLSGQSIVEGGPRVFSVTLAGDDHLKVDNTRWRVVDVASEMRVLIVEGDRGIGALAGSGSFLELALSPPKDLDPDAARSGNTKTDSYVAPEPPIGELELANKILTNYRAVFLTNVGQVNPNQADQLKRYVEQGGTLVLFVGPAVSSDNYNQQLVPRGLLPGRLIKTVSTNDAAFHFDFNPKGNLHPFLREFKDQENSGLSTAQVWSYWQLELPANTNAERVLEYQAQGPDKPKDPAVTVHPLGRGRVVFFSTTANPEWNGLTPKPAYVALMHEILAGSVGSADRWMNLTVGDRLDVPQSLGLTAAPQLSDASKNAVLMEPTTDQAGVTTYHSAKPMTRPGVYSLSIGNRTIPIAVNVPANEADVRVLPPESVKKALGDIDLGIEDDSVQLAGVKADSSNDWSWGFMAAVLALAALECFLAMRFGHYKRGKRLTTPTPEPAPAT